jgi:hypothetical protein
MGVEMIKMRQRKLIFALMVLLPIFAGCKSESPTAPAPSTGGSPSGGVTPPVGATITLTVSNSSPVVNSTSTITANVTVSNQAVPNGTAVEFSTNLGTFTDTGTNTTVKITNGGNASAILTSGTAGTATVIVTVNNSTKSTTITFGAGTTPPTTGGAPTITSVAPNFGLPTGGQQVTINGTNFRTPLRVLFDPGNGQAAKEGFVVSSTSTQIVVVTPAFDIGSGQTLPVTVTVITQAGTQGEQTVSLPAAFTFQLAVLTPTLRAVQPTSGPIGGGTRVTIFGDAFQTPVQVFFGAAEAQVISVNFSQLIVMSPRASDTAPGGSGVVTGPVNVRVLNVSSGKEATLSGGFRYVPKMVITTFGPGEGPSTGGTRVTIDGVGFDDPLAVGIGGIAAQVIRVSGSEIIAITSPVVVTGCANTTGPVVVTNTENGDSASSLAQFIYRIAKPAIISVTPAAFGGTTTIVVLNAQGVARIIIGGIQAQIVSQTVNPDGTTSFVVQIPASLKLDTLACSGVSGANAPQPTAFDVTYTSATTGCTDTAVKALIVSPPGGPVIFFVPPAFTPFQGVITPATVGPPPTPATVVVTPASQTVDLVNIGNGPLNITAVTLTAAGGTGCARFNVSTGGVPATLNQCEIFPIIASYNAPTTPTPVPDQCNVTLTTNAGNRTLTLIGSSQ